MWEGARVPNENLMCKRETIIPCQLYKVSQMTIITPLFKKNFEKFSRWAITFLLLKGENEFFDWQFLQKWNREVLKMTNNLPIIKRVKMNFSIGSSCKKNLKIGFFKLTSSFSSINSLNTNCELFQLVKRNMIS